MGMTGYPQTQRSACVPGRCGFSAGSVPRAWLAYSLFSYVKRQISRYTYNVCTATARPSSMMILSTLVLQAR